MYFIRFGQNGEGGEGAFGFTEFESVFKIEVAPFLAALGSVFAGNSATIPEQLIVHELGDVPIAFLVGFYLSIEHFRENFRNVETGQMTLLARPYFGIDLSNPLDLEETAVVGVFKVAEFECFARIEMAPFLVALGSIFA